MPEFHGGEQPFRTNLIGSLPMIAEEIKAVTGNADHVEGQSKIEVEELNARFGSLWR